MKIKKNYGLSRLRDLHSVLLLFLLSTAFYLLPTVSIAQITFERTYGDTASDSGRSVQQTVPDGGYIIVGHTYSFGAGMIDIYLIKTDSLGDTLWSKTYGGTDDDWGSSVQQNSDGGFIIVGNTGSFGAGLRDVYLIRTNSSGDTLWTKTYGDSDIDNGRSVKQTQDGGFIISGFTYSFGADWYDVYLFRTNSFGDTLWTKTYGGIAQDNGWSVQETSDGGFVIAGYTYSFGTGGSDVYLIRTNSTGDTLWTKTYGGIGRDYGRSVQQTQDGGFIISGNTYSYGAGYSDVYLIRTNSTGDTLWTKTYGDTNWDYGYSVQETSDGGFIIAGETSSYGAGSYDLYLIRTDSTGNALWTKTYGGTDWDNGYSVQQTSDGGFIIVGTTLSFGAGSGDIYLIKTDSLGNVFVGIEEEPDSGGFRNAEFGLLQNQPNPFNKLTAISYQIPLTPFNKGGQRGIPVRLAIYDITGRLVETLVEKPHKPGVYQVQWDGKDQSSGIYFYRLQSGNYTDTKKLILLK
jgi:hypothetical protein